MIKEQTFKILKLQLFTFRYIYHPQIILELFYFISIYPWLMSNSEEKLQTSIQEKIDPGKPYIYAILQRFNTKKSFEIQLIIEDVVAFLSVISAYQYVSQTYKKQSLLQDVTSIQFTSKRTQTVLLLIFGVYLISLKILYFITHYYETSPPKKIVPENWEQMQQQPAQRQQDKTNEPTPGQQRLPSVNTYTVIIEQLIKTSIYGFVFMLCITSYTYINLLNKNERLVDIQQVNLLIFWFVTANVFYSVGKLIGKMTNIRTLHYFGFMIGIFVVSLQIGLAHGFNTFVFI